MRLCLARVVTPRLTRAMSGPPYFRPYGAQAFTRAVSALARTSVPRFWRMYLALWLISRWRLPATPCFNLPVAVSLKRFLTPLLVFNLGIFVSLPHGGGRLRTATAALVSRAVRFFQSWKESAPIEGEGGIGNLPSSRRRPGPRAAKGPAPSRAGVPACAGMTGLVEQARHRALVGD